MNVLNYKQFNINCCDFLFKLLLKYKIRRILMPGINEIICRNIEILILRRGIKNYSAFVKACGFSPAYSALLRDPSRVNPTAKMLETMAKVLEVEIGDLVDPNLSIESIISLPEGYSRKSFILSDPQRITVERWEQQNIQEIKEIKHQNFLLQENVKKFASGLSINKK